MSAVCGGCYCTVGKFGEMAQNVAVLILVIF